MVEGPVQKFLTMICKKETQKQSKHVLKSLFWSFFNSKIKANSSLWQPQVLYCTIPKICTKSRGCHVVRWATTTTRTWCGWPSEFWTRKGAVPRSLWPPTSLSGYPAWFSNDPFCLPNLVVYQPVCLSSLSVYRVCLPIQPICLPALSFYPPCLSTHLVSLSTTSVCPACLSSSLSAYTAYLSVYQAYLPFHPVHTQPDCVTSLFVYPA